MFRILGENRIFCAVEYRTNHLHHFFHGMLFVFFWLLVKDDGEDEMRIIIVRNIEEETQHKNKMDSVNYTVAI